MDLSRASTEAFAQYREFHEKFNRDIPVGTAAFELIARLVDDDEAGGAVLTALVDAVRAPWARNRKFPEPRTRIVAARQMFANMAIVRSWAALDNYLTALVVDAVAFAPAVRQLQPFAHEHTDGQLNANGVPRPSCCHVRCDTVLGGVQIKNRIAVMGTIFEWNADRAVADLMPLAHLFRRARNRLVHYDGTVGKRLAEYAQCDDVAVARKKWNERFGRREAPALPQLEENAKLAYAPHHVILAEAVFYQLAQRMNRHVVQAMGEEGVIRMAAFYSLLAANHSGRGPRQNEPAAAVNAFLSRYRVGGATSTGTRRVLEELGLSAAARVRFQTLYPRR